MYNKIAGGTTAVGSTGSVTLAHTGFAGAGYAVAAVTCLLAGAALLRYVRTLRKASK